MKKSIIVIVAALCVFFGSYSYHHYVNGGNEVQIKPVANAIINKGNYRLFVPAKTLNDFVLEHHQGEFTKDDLVGQWTFVIFGYTYCPDVCPTTLSHVKRVMPLLRDVASVQVVFVSADPLRDTPQRLAQYVNYFEQSFVGVTTTHDKLFPFAQNLYLPYGIVAEKKTQDYAVNHSASIALVNPDGQYVAQFKPEYKPGTVPMVNMDDMADSFKNIVQQSMAR